MTFPEVQYDFPKGGLNPFTIDSTEKYFIYASGLSNLSKELGVFNLKNFEKHIPFGYKTILTLERITFYTNGQHVPDFDYSSQLTKSDSFYLISNKLRKTHIKGWSRDIESYSILRTMDDASLKSYVWDKYEDANSIAQKISINDNSTVLLCKILDNIHWH